MSHVIRELVGAAAMDFLASQWRDLYRQDAAATVYQSPQWLTGWAEQLPVTATPVVLVAQSPTGRTLGALALAREDPSAAGPARTFALSAPMAEYVRPIGPHAEDPAVAAGLAFHLVLLSEREHVEITDVPTSSQLSRYLAQADAGWSHGTLACAEVPLPLDLDSMSRSTKRDHQRRERTWTRLADTHQVTYHRTRNRQELHAAYAVLAQLHESRWARQALLPGMALTDGATQWQAVLDHCASNAFIATLALDDTVIAAQLCLVRGRTCYSLIPAMDPTHRPLAPGHALLRQLASDLAGEGFTALDLGRTAPGQESYKRQYRPIWSSTLSAVTTPQAAAA
ncbi:GNAT family N-acetyltransferase [Streptomyces sp. NPDC058247]|uniref:GNAT family N-acetyltransferase n=1 Tax=Streptomyces sp. NPDC058247 TaxID=3346401 RepID=UPI0036E85338